jgi:hypothetical protein
MADYDDNHIPYEYNITIISGNNYTRNILFTDAITSYTFTAIVKSIDDSTVATFTTSTNDKTVTISLSKTQTALLCGSYTWYLDRTLTTETRTLLSGTFKVKRK